MIQETGVLTNLYKGRSRSILNRFSHKNTIQKQRVRVLFVLCNGPYERHNVVILNYYFYCNDGVSAETFWWYSNNIQTI